MRKIKTVKVTFNEIENVDKKVNDTIDELAENGHKVVSITTSTFGLSPMYLIYTIIYESKEG